MLLSPGRNKYFDRQNPYTTCQIPNLVGGMGRSCFSGLPTKHSVTVTTVGLTGGRHGNPDVYMPTNLSSGPGLCSVSCVFSGMFPAEARFSTSRMKGSNEQMHMTCLTPGLTLVSKTTGCH